MLSGSNEPLPVSWREWISSTGGVHLRQFLAHFGSQVAQLGDRAGRVSRVIDMADLDLPIR